MVETVPPLRSRGFGMVMWLRSPAASDLLEMFGMAMARAGYVVIAVDQPGNNSVAHYDFWLHRKNRSQSGQCRLRVRLGGKSPVANDPGHTAWTLKGQSCPSDLARPR
jgi:hypothetical protein